MRRVTAEFVTSAARGEDTPRDGLPQMALVGRSNVGKSTLINALTHTRLARTSATAGKTRLANIYRIAAGQGLTFYLVDLPGYGYARAPRQARGGPSSAEGRRRQATEEFETLISGYFRLRAEGRGPDAALMVVDARHPALETDVEARGWLAESAVPTVVAVNKVDKLSRADRARMARQHAGALDAEVVEISASRGEGLDELWTQIARLLKNPNRPPR
ncbi:MAG: ribosome biogenesis GTP-binding protein YihA/YsxC [Vicinamibacterales bacterium]